MQSHKPTHISHVPCDKVPLDSWLRINTTICILEHSRTLMNPEVTLASSDGESTPWPQLELLEVWQVTLPVPSQLRGVPFDWVHQALATGSSLKIIARFNVCECGPGWWRLRYGSCVSALGWVRSQPRNNDLCQHFWLGEIWPQVLPWCQII